MGAEGQILAWAGLWDGPVELRVTSLLCPAALFPVTEAPLPDW